jgi:thiamine biosynthesis lipoprotein
LKLKKGMEIDFGGIVKEYAVDKCLELATQGNSTAVLVNFGEDLAVNAPPKTGSWTVAIEEAFKRKLEGAKLAIKSGALATSGDTHRFLVHEGRRYSHILNPKTGYPVENGVATITVQAPSCTLAGLFATISHLHQDPVGFLEAQNMRFWVLRH